jgi:anaerobic glycerol-3-phosphate dehydrogenase
MANIDAAFGFRPIGKVGSGVNNSGTTLYTIEDNANLTAYKGDHVMASGGYIVAGTASGATNVGVFNGCFYIDPTSKKPTWSNYYNQTNVTATGSISGSTNIDAYIYDDPYYLFEIQTDATVAKTAIGKNADSIIGTGSTVNGQSKHEMDSGSTTTIATSAGLQMKIIGITKDPENDDASSANSNWYVMFNEHVKLGTGITGT